MLLKAELNETKIEAEKHLCSVAPYMDMHKNESVYDSQADKCTMTTKSAPMAKPSDLSLSTAWPAFSEPTTARTTFGPSESIVADFSMMLNNN